MRVADVQLAFPVIMLAIAIVAVVGTNPLALVGVLALSGWVLYARAIRAHVLTIRRLDYIEAADHQKRLEGILQQVRDAYPDATLAMRERRQRKTLALTRAAPRSAATGALNRYTDD